MIRFKKSLVVFIILCMCLFITNYQIVNCIVVDDNNTKIVFSSYLDGNSDIYIIKPDGTGLLNITDDEYNNFLPTWSPDGTKIAYASRPEDDIFIIDINGENKMNLTSSSNYASFPDWSPDGRKIIYMSKTDEENDIFNIFVINVNGLNPIQLTNDDFINTHPKWSPDGSKIAFVSNRNGSFGLFVMDRDGNNIKFLTKLTDITTLDIIEALSLSWSPDGSKIAFSSENKGNFDIFIINTDGSNLTNITNTDSVIEALPTWSPDGLYIAFISLDENANQQLYIMDNDGNGKRKITNKQFNISNPDWLPFL